jgi:hypothetical protein
LLSPWYQRLWGKRFKITQDQNTKSHFNTSAGGARISTSTRGSLLGIGGDIVLIDDSHNMAGVESDAARSSQANLRPLVFSITWAISVMLRRDRDRSSLP